MSQDQPNFVIIFPPRDLNHNYVNSWSFYLQVARQMGLGPFWQTMRHEWEHSSDVGWLGFTVPEDFIPSTENFPVT